MAWILFCLVLSLVVNLIVASEMKNIVVLKDYPDADRYFWFSFLLGLPGWLMVVALPTQSPSGKPGYGFGIPQPAQPAPKAQPAPRNEPVKASAQVTAVPAKESKPAEPVCVSELDGQVQCPNCGLWQKANRSLCWKCGTQFKKDSNS